MAQIAAVSILQYRKSDPVFVILVILGNYQCNCLQDLGDNTVWASM